MSGGFFRGTSADQDTRFSNKTAKLLKTQKFAPELDQLVDMTKVNMDVMRPWIATRVTQLLGFEDEVLINFIYGLLEGKNVDGKQIQIQLTGFMEKNTGKFMRELWGLLLSAQNNISKIPQQFLDEKAEETRLKKAEEQRVISEMRRKEEEKREAEKGRAKKLDDVGPEKSDLQASRRSPSPKGEKSADDDRVHVGNGKVGTRSSPLRARSRSRISSKSASRSPVPTNRRRTSRSTSRSPRRHWSRSPRRRGRSPINVRRRSRSPRSPRRARSPYLRSPRRRHRSPVYSHSPRGQYSRSPRGRSPRLTRRWRSPVSSRAPRDWSPISRSPRRHRSPISPRRRKSPVRSPPRYHRRSPRYSRASPQRQASPPPRIRQAAASPHRYPGRSPPRRRSPLPRHDSASPPARAPSYEAHSPSPMPPSPHLPQSHSPHRAGRQRLMSKSLSPLPRHRRHHTPDAAASREQKVSQQSERQPKIPSSYSPSSNASIPSRERRSRSASVDKDAVRNPLDREAKFESQEITGRPRRAQSSSSDSLTMTEAKEVLPMQSTDDIPSVTKQRKTERSVRSVSVSSENDGTTVKDTTAVESDDIEAHGPVNVYDRKAAKKRHREEKKLRKKEKKRRREEKHRRKEEKRASKISSKEIPSVTPPPGTDRRTKYEESDNATEHIVEEEQRRIEDELRRKALDSIRAKKVNKP